MVCKVKLYLKPLTNLVFFACTARHQRHSREQAVWVQDSNELRLFKLFLPRDKFLNLPTAFAFMRYKRAQGIYFCGQPCDLPLHTL